jgi:predicted AAA+ superfamily ATPase
MYIPRTLEKTLRDTGKSFRAVLVTGPRQVGKSTFLQHLYPDIPYITFDDPIILSRVKEEPGLFFRDYHPPVVLDEVQHITELFPYIKMQCDQADQNGRFFLTGSQQYRMMKNISESLAGRVEILELQGLSLRELQGIDYTGHFIPTDEYLESRKNSSFTCPDIWKVIYTGGYPGMQQKGMNGQLFYGPYVQTYLDRDVNDLLRVKDKIKFTQFLTVMAARTGQMLNYANVANELDISLQTVKNWTSILEASGIICLLQPYSNSALTRAVKTPKLYFRDTGLVCYLTRQLTAEMASVSAMAGSLFETFVVSEIVKSYANEGLDYRFYMTYYRGKDKNRDTEIDLILEENDTLYPVEIKMSANPKLSMTDNFDVLDKIGSKKKGRGTVVCLYDKVIHLNEKNIALPVEYV